MEWAQVKNKKKIEKHTHTEKSLVGRICKSQHFFTWGHVGTRVMGRPHSCRGSRGNGRGGSGAVDVLVLEEGLIREVTVHLISLG